VAGRFGANLLIRGIILVPAGVPNAGSHHAGCTAEEIFLTPKAPAGEYGYLEVFFSGALFSHSS
jgi:hypothetical protein